MENEESKIVIEKQVSSFELTKNTKGYNWSIKVYDEDLEVAKQKVLEVDAFAKEKWGNERSIQG